jgi:hypothetical protein
MTIQNSSLAAPPGWPGLPPDGPAVDRPERRTRSFFAGDSTIFLFMHENSFTCELNLYAYISIISSHKT